MDDSSSHHTKKGKIAANEPELQGMDFLTKKLSETNLLGFFQPKNQPERRKNTKNSGSSKKHQIKSGEDQVKDRSFTPVDVHAKPENVDVNSTNSSSHMQTVYQVPAGTSDIELRKIRNSAATRLAYLRKELFKSGFFQGQAGAQGGEQLSRTPPHGGGGGGGGGGDDDDDSGGGGDDDGDDRVSRSYEDGGPAGGAPPADAGHWRDWVLVQAVAAQARRMGLAAEGGGGGGSGGGGGGRLAEGGAAAAAPGGERSDEESLGSAELDRADFPRYGSFLQHMPPLPDGPPPGPGPGPGPPPPPGLRERAVSEALSDVGRGLFLEAVVTPPPPGEGREGEVCQIFLAPPKFDPGKFAKDALSQLKKLRQLLDNPDGKPSDKNSRATKARFQAVEQTGERNSVPRQIIPASDIAPGNRRIWVITTASLPWLTGTAVNPLLRAAYLARERDPGMVTLMVPWLEEEDQLKVFPGGRTFATEEDQRQYVLAWLRGNAKFRREAAKLRVRFYPARYLPAYGSIFPMGDMLGLVPDDEADVAILEEPEHINWFKPSGEPWTEKFVYVIGIMHTNYQLYARGETLGWFKEHAVRWLNVWMARAYCDRIIKLSATLQEYAPEKEVVCNVHGIRDAFLEIGDRAALEPPRGGAYFIGKMLWGKGYDLMLELMAHAKRRMGAAFPLDVYGSGPDQAAIQRQFRRRKFPAAFHPAQDHAALEDYKVFINPSVSEVLCTTTAEALGMGKFAVVPDHPSNAFFKSFSNCLMYKTKDEFCANVYWALAHRPEPLSPEDRYALTWEAATERLVRAAATSSAVLGRRREGWDRLARRTHAFVGANNGRGDLFRALAGGGRVAGQAAYMKKVKSTSSLEDGTDGESTPAAPHLLSSMSNQPSPKQNSESERESAISEKSNIETSNDRTKSRRKKRSSKPKDHSK